jgi:hypothetical protein
MVDMVAESKIGPIATSKTLADDPIFKGQMIRSSLFHRGAPEHVAHYARRPTP